MNWITLTSLIITLTQGVLAGLTAANAPAEIISALQNALTELGKVHGTLVTKAQVDSVTLQFKW